MNFTIITEQNSLEAVQSDYWKLVLPHKGTDIQGYDAGS